MNKKILHLNFSDDGGAAIAVMRIHNALKQNNFESKVLVAEKLNKFDNVFCNQNNFDKFIWKQKKKISRNLKFLFKTKNKNTHTISFFNSNIFDQIDHFNPDIINIHWIIVQRLQTYSLLVKTFHVS